MCFRGEDKQLVTLVVAGNRVDDDALLKELEDNGVPEDEEFFRKCLTGPFPKSAKFLLKRDLENGLLDKNLVYFSKMMETPNIFLLFFGAFAILFAFF